MARRSSGHGPPQVSRGSRPTALVLHRQLERVVADGLELLGVELQLVHEALGGRRARWCAHWFASLEAELEGFELLEEGFDRGPDVVKISALAVGVAKRGGRACDVGVSRILYGLERATSLKVISIINGIYACTVSLVSHSPSQPTRVVFSRTSCLDSP